MPTLSEIKKNILSELRSLPISESEARRECDLILQYATKSSTAQQVLRANLELSSQEISIVGDVIEKRRARIPLQYCLGSTWFMDSQFWVEPGIFIPRSDTETLVLKSSEIISAASDNAVEQEREDGQSVGRAKFNVVEVGIGSGAISVCLLKLHATLEILAVDKSHTACSVARKNADFNNVSARLQIKQGDWRDLLPGNIDLLVSNPPYIPMSESVTLAPEVAEHEPAEALFGTDEDGLGFYRDFARLVPGFLRDGRGFIAVEVGDKQSGSVSEIFSTAGWSEVSSGLDMNGIPRVVTARKL